MGFDLTVDCALHVCSKTGKLFYYGKDVSGNFVRIYELPKIEVPEEYRAEMVQRGSIFHAYTNHFNEKDIFNVDIHDFLGEFPSWTTVKEWMTENGWTKDDWGKEKHQTFEAALKWCASAGLPFRVTWSY